MMDCQCQTAGYCETLKRRMVGRPYQICQGVNVSPMVREGYLAKWAAEAITPPPKVPVIVSPRECTHMGKEVETRLCPTCGGKVQVKVFECTIHHLCSMGKEVGVKVCRGCEEYSPLLPTAKPAEHPQAMPEEIKDCC